METTGVDAVRAHLSRLLDEVAAGKSIIITKRGVLTTLGHSAAATGVPLVQ